MKTYFIMSNCLFASFTPLAIHQSYINTVFPVILKTFAEWIRFKWRKKKFPEMMQFSDSFNISDHNKYIESQKEVF